MTCKLVYSDSGTTKVLEGVIVDDKDSTFITIITTQNNKFRINKQFVISIKEGVLNGR